MQECSGSFTSRRSRDADFDFRSSLASITSQGINKVVLGILELGAVNGILILVTETVDDFTSEVNQLLASEITNHGSTNSVHNGIPQTSTTCVAANVVTDGTIVENTTKTHSANRARRVANGASQQATGAARTRSESGNLVGSAVGSSLAAFSNVILFAQALRAEARRAARRGSILEGLFTVAADRGSGDAVGELCQIALTSRVGTVVIGRRRETAVGTTSGSVEHGLNVGGASGQAFVGVTALFVVRVLAIYNRRTAAGAAVFGHGLFTISTSGFGGGITSSNLSQSALTSRAASGAVIGGVLCWLFSTSTHTNISGGDAARRFVVSKGQSGSQGQQAEHQSVLHGIV